MLDVIKITRNYVGVVLRNRKIKEITITGRKKSLAIEKREKESLYVCVGVIVYMDYQTRDRIIKYHNPSVSSHRLS